MSEEVEITFKNKRNSGGSGGYNRSNRSGDRFGSSRNNRSYGSSSSNRSNFNSNNFKSKIQAIVTKASEKNGDGEQQSTEDILNAINNALKSDQESYNGYRGDRSRSMTPRYNHKNDEENNDSTTSSSTSSGDSPHRSKYGSRDNSRSNESFNRRGSDRRFSSRGPRDNADRPRRSFGDRNNDRENSEGFDRKQRGYSGGNDRRFPRDNRSGGGRRPSYNRNMSLDGSKGRRFAPREHEVVTDLRKKISILQNAKKIDGEDKKDE